MRYVHFSSKTIAIIVACSASAACGSQTRASIDDAPAAQQKLTGGDADVITDVAFEAVVAEKEFTDRSSAPECLALRAQINILRPALLAKAEWISLVKTQAWDKLNNDYDAYVAGNCPAVTLPATEISESCAAARTQLLSDWGTVAGSSEYKVVQTHEALTSLTDKWTRARTAGCIDH